jgi:uncharacterized protein (DUF1015 family)
MPRRRPDRAEPNPNAWRQSAAFVFGQADRSLYVATRTSPELTLTLIKPFRALRPAPGRAADVLAPPYDVLSSAEARERANGKPWSFLHVSKAEIDLPPATDPYDPAVYAKAAENLRRTIAAGVLIRDESPCYYAYRLTWRGHVQTGLAAVASLADYATNRIRKHELTTPGKEDDRVRQIDAVNAQTGPVMVAYPSAPQIDAALAQETAGVAAVDVTGKDGVRHQLWPITDAAKIESLTRAVDALPTLYIADGHHRSAAALRVARARGDGGDAAHNYFLAVLFPQGELTILDYNRVLRDLNGRTPEGLLKELRSHYDVETSERPVRPAEAAEFGMYLNDRWYRLIPRGAGAVAPMPSGDPIARLPITYLTRTIIEPMFGITDPRVDKRIDFVGGGRGLEELERLVSSGAAAVAFALYPTQMNDLMAVADAGAIMPPKSTWFEPKLADGMVSHVLD